MEKDNSRIFGYDLIKTIAIFMIVFYHLGGEDYGVVVPGEYYLPNTAKFFSAFMAASVPLFLMVNGALIIPRNWNFHQAAIHAVRLLFLYLFWKLLLQDLICKCIFGIQEEMVHFWFLRTLAIIYLLVSFFAKHPICRKVLLVSLLIFPFLSNLTGDLVAYFRPDIVLPSFAHSGLFTLYTLLYFYLGWMLKDYKWQLWKSLLSILLGLFLVNFEVVAMSNNTGSVYDSVNAAFPTIGALFTSVGIYQLLKDIVFPSANIQKAITYIGKNTLGIFFFHVPIIFVLRDFYSEYMNHIGIMQSLFWALSFLFLTSLLSFAIRKTPIHFLLPM